MKPPREVSEPIDCMEMDAFSVPSVSYDVGPRLALFGLHPGRRLIGIGTVVLVMVFVAAMLATCFSTALETKSISAPSPLSVAAAEYSSVPAVPAAASLSVAEAQHSTAFTSAPPEPKSNGTGASRLPFTPCSGNKTCAVDCAAGDTCIGTPVGWVGYNGNATIYPTNDTANITTGDSGAGVVTAVPLPLLHSVEWQTWSNSTSQMKPLSNFNALNVSTVASEYPRYWNLGPNDNWEVWVTIWVVSTGVSAQNDSWPNGCNNEANEQFTGAIEVSATPSGLPSGNTNVFAAGNNTGTNVTLGDMSGESGQSGDLLTHLIGFGLAAAAFIVTIIQPEIGLVLTGADAAYDANAAFTGASGPEASFYGTATDNDVAGDATANQLEVVKGGDVTTLCGDNGGATGGQNVFTQASQIEEQIPAPGNSPSGMINPGSLKISSFDDQEFLDNNDPSGSFTVVASNPSISYSIEPAVSVGGYIRLWAGGPTITGAVVNTQEQYDNQTWFQNNYVTTSSDGYYHDFLDPNVWYNSQQALWSDVLGTTYSASIHEPIGEELAPSGTDGKALPLDNLTLDGGQVNGHVTGNGDGQNISGATVKLCNVFGNCISTTTSSSGYYAMDFPVAGNSTYPYSLTISASGEPTTTTSGLQLQVGEYDVENLMFPYNSNYAVSFTESGLPSGETWTACLPSSSCKSASAGSKISFTGLSGGNSWSVEEVVIGVCGIDVYYDPSPSSGTVYSPATIAVTYTETSDDSPLRCTSGPASSDPATDGAGIVGSGDLTPAGGVETQAIAFSLSSGPPRPQSGGASNLSSPLTRSAKAVMQPPYLSFSVQAVNASDQSVAGSRMLASRERRDAFRGPSPPEKWGGLRTIQQREEIERMRGLARSRCLGGTAPLPLMRTPYD